MSTPRQGGAFGDELANFGIIALIAAAVIAVLLRVAGTVTAWVTGAVQPAGGVEAGLGVLLHPADPGSALGTDGLNPVAYWIVAGILILLKPDLLAKIVAIYLIVVGALGLLG